MKILFIHPNEYLCTGIPTGMSSLIAVLRQAGHTVSVFDFTFFRPKNSEKKEEASRAGRTVYLPTSYTLEDLIKDYPDDSLEDSFEEKLNTFKPDLIGMSAMSSNFDKGIKVLKKFKSKLKCKVVVGGIHATIAPEDALRPDVVDMICVGDGEKFMLELCDCLSSGKDYKHINNLGYKKGNSIHINKIGAFMNMDELPTPDWSDFDSNHLFRAFMGKVYTGSFYIMSRGCPYKCTYCANSPLREKLKGSGKYYRFQKPGTTIKQLKELKKLYNATYFRFADDSIMSMKDEYLEELSEGVACLGITFSCSVRPETTTIEKVLLLKKMGCVAASIGIESGNEGVRRTVLNRKMTNKQIGDAITLFKSNGIRVSTFNLLGLPDETRENVFETIRLNKNFNVDSANVYIVYPYPGTQIAIDNKTKFRDSKGKMIPVAKASSYALSKMKPVEVEGLLKTFNLRLLLPEKLWPIVDFTEKNDETADIIYNALEDYAISLLKE